MTLTTTRNPRGRAVRATNYSPNPKLGVNSTDWLFNAGTTSAAAVRGTTTLNGLAVGYYEVDWTGPTTSYTGGLYTPNAAFPINQGLPITHSVWVYCQRVQRIGIVLSYADGNSATGPQYVLAANTWTRVSYTAVPPATASGARMTILSVAGTSASFWANGDRLAATCHCVTVGTTLLDYFDGGTAASGDLTYAWTGAVDLSTSLSYWSDPASLIAPQLVLGWDEVSGARNVFHELLSGAVVLVQRAGQPRSGLLKLFFLTRAEAMNCRAQHRLAGLWTYVDSDNPETGMSYGVSGDIHLYNDAARLRWTVEIPFRELS